MTDLTFIKLTDIHGKDRLVCVNLIASVNRMSGYTSIYLNTHGSNSPSRVDVKEEVETIARRLVAAAEAR